MAKCPFTLLEQECPGTNKGKDGCHLWHRVIRHYDSTDKDEIVEDCVFILDHEERRMHGQRLGMLQSEMGATKQSSLFQGLIMLNDSPLAKKAMEQLAKRHIDPNETTKLTEGGSNGAITRG